jgi:hypothetical protein
MGNAVSTSVKPLEAPFKNCLRLERLIAAECDFLPASRSEDNIRVGIIGNSDPENPLSHQAIRFGDSDAYRLQSFTKGENTLTYTFEKNVNLTLMKRRDSILYNLKTPEFDVTREINPTIVRMYKSIGMASDELDNIRDLFQMK